MDGPWFRVRFLPKNINLSFCPLINTQPLTLIEDRERTAGLELSVQTLDCGMDGPWFRVWFLESARHFFLFSKMSKYLLSLSFTCFFFQGVKRPWRQVNYSSPTSADVKNVWSSTSTPPTCLHGVNRENFTSMDHRNFKTSYCSACWCEGQWLAHGKGTLKELQKIMCNNICFFG